MKVVVQKEPPVPVVQAVMGVSIMDLSPREAAFLRLVLGCLSVPDRELGQFVGSLYVALPNNPALVRDITMETVFIKHAP